MEIITKKDINHKESNNINQIQNNRENFNVKSQIEELFINGIIKIVNKMPHYQQKQDIKYQNNIKILKEQLKTGHLIKILDLITKFDNKFRRDSNFYNGEHYVKFLKIIKKVPITGLKVVNKSESHQIDNQYFFKNHFEGDQEALQNLCKELCLQSFQGNYVIISELNNQISIDVDYYEVSKDQQRYLLKGNLQILKLIQLSQDAKTIKEILEICPKLLDQMFIQTINDNQTLENNIEWINISQKETNQNQSGIIDSSKQVYNKFCTYEFLFQAISKQPQILDNVSSNHLKNEKFSLDILKQCEPSNICIQQKQMKCKSNSNFVIKCIEISDNLYRKGIQFLSKSQSNKNIQNWFSLLIKNMKQSKDFKFFNHCYVVETTYTIDTKQYQFIEEIVKIKGKLLNYIPEEDRTKKLVKLALQNDIGSIEQTVLKDDLEFLTEILIENPEYIAVSSVQKHKARNEISTILNKYIEDRDIILSIVEKNGLALEFLKDEHKADKEIAIQAIQNNGWAVKFISKELYHDTDVMEIAMQDDNIFNKEQLQSCINNLPNFKNKSDMMFPRVTITNQDNNMFLNSNIDTTLKTSFSIGLKSKDRQNIKKSQQNKNKISSK